MGLISLDWIPWVQGVDKGNEILVPMKVFAKADREPTRTFSLIIEQIGIAPTHSELQL